MHQRTLSAPATVLAGLGLATIAIPAVAEVDEILVTAQRREESVESIPMAVQAVAQVSYQGGFVLIPILLAGLYGWSDLQQREEATVRDRVTLARSAASTPSPAPAPSAAAA